MLPLESSHPVTPKAEWVVELYPVANKNFYQIWNPKKLFYNMIYEYTYVHVLDVEVQLTTFEVLD